MLPWPDLLTQGLVGSCEQDRTTQGGAAKRARLAKSVANTLSLHYPETRVALPYPYPRDWRVNFSLELLFADLLYKKCFISPVLTVYCQHPSPPSHSSPHIGKV